MSSTEDSERLLSRDEVEQRFGISKRFLELAVQKRTGPRYVRIGSLVRYTVKDIRDWISENTVEPDQ